jgi:hypothetical protein
VLTLLSGGSVPGVMRERRLRGLPSRKCYLIGKALPEQVLILCHKDAPCRALKGRQWFEGVQPTHVQACEAARQFNLEWPSKLQLLWHDCHHHTSALLQHLTGREIAINATVLLRGHLPRQ